MASDRRMQCYVDDAIAVTVRMQAVVAVVNAVVTLPLLLVLGLPQVPLTLRSARGSRRLRRSGRRQARSTPGAPPRRRSRPAPRGRPRAR